MGLDLSPFRRLREISLTPVIDNVPSSLALFFRRHFRNDLQDQHRRKAWLTREQRLRLARKRIRLDGSRRRPALFGGVPRREECSAGGIGRRSSPGKYGTTPLPNREREEPVDPKSLRMCFSKVLSSRGNRLHSTPTCEFILSIPISEIIYLRPWTTFGQSSSQWVPVARLF